MAEVRLTDAAKADLDEIFDYSVDAWGEAQARRYAQEIASVLAKLAERPQTGRVHRASDPDLRLRVIRSHVAYYRVKPYGIRILRVLHERMLADDRIDEADDA